MLLTKTKITRMEGQEVSNRGGRNVIECFIRVYREFEGYAVSNRKPVKFLQYR